MQNLLQGLLADIPRDRWGGKEIRQWIKRQEHAHAETRVHRQTTATFSFDEKEYGNRKHLAHALFQRWHVARRTLRTLDLARWLTVAIKRSDIADRVEQMNPSGRSEIVLPDDKLMRLITMLDPEGPLRYQGLSCHVSGLAGFLVHSYVQGSREAIQSLAETFNHGLVDHWIRQQPDPEAYTLMEMGWSPIKVRQFIRRPALGFSIERCLYECYRMLPCQSPFVGAHHVTTLPDLLTSLDAYQGNKDETDPVDRHVAAFIASRIDLTEDIRVKTLKNFPQLGKQLQVSILGLLTVAQVESRIPQLKGLTDWMHRRLSSLIDLLHNRALRREMKQKMQQAAKEGTLTALFRVVADPAYARRDFYGFHEARKHYRQLGAEIARLQKQSNIERMAYQIGLRIAVTFSYLAAISTLLYVLIHAF